MLMGAFGVMSEVLTLWTDAGHPYDELITEEEAIARTEGGEAGKWVPTPYIDIAIDENADYPQFSASRADLGRLREQIAIFKPINVVFRDFVFRLVDSLKLLPTIAIASTSGRTNLGAVDAAANELVVDYASPTGSACR